MRRYVANTAVRCSSSLATPLSVARRDKLRNSWPTAFPDEDFIPFPNEHLGDQYALNHCIAAYNMTAPELAFRNLHPRGLAMHAERLMPGSRAVVVDADPAAAGPLLAVGSPQLGDATFGRVVREVREHLSQQRSLFVHDGSVGLVAGAGPTVRTFADSAAAALMLHNTLRTHALPLLDDAAELQRWRATLPEDLRYADDRVAQLVRSGQLQAPPPRPASEVTQFVAAHWRPSEELLAQLGGRASVSIVDLQRKIVVHTGSNAVARSVRGGLVALAGTAAPLAVHAALLGDRSVLIFGDATGELWSQHHTLWNAATSTLTPAWLATERSVAASEPLREGDYVERTGSQQWLLRNNRGPRAPFNAAAPAAVVFVTGAAKKTTKKTAAATATAWKRVNPEQARVLAQEAGPAAALDSLTAYVVKHKVPLVSTTDAEVNQAWLESVFKA